MGMGYGLLHRRTRRDESAFFELEEVTNRSGMKD